MKKIFFVSLISVIFFSCNNGTDGPALEEKQSTVNVSAYKDEQGNLQWVRVDNGEQIEVLPLSDCWVILTATLTQIITKKNNLLWCKAIPSFTKPYCTKVFW